MSAIATVAPVFSEKVGARIFAVANITIPTKYTTEGCEISEALLRECGLTLGQVDFGIVLNAPVAAKGANQAIAVISVTNPSATPPSPTAEQKVKVQLYTSVTTAANKEEASEGEVYKAAVLTVLLVGR